MTPKQIPLAGRIGALRMHAAGKTNTGPARRAFEDPGADGHDAGPAAITSYGFQIIEEVQIPLRDGTNIAGASMAKPIA